MSYMFSYASDFNQPLDSWDVSSVTYMNYMFNSANNYSNHNMSGWNVSSVISHYDFLTNAGSGNTEPNWP